jgi:hypothetical protein
MNIDTLTKKKLLIGLTTLTACYASWTLFTAPAVARVAAVQEVLAKAQSELASTERKAGDVSRLEDDLLKLRTQLDEASERLINGDKYLWVIRNLAKYQVPQLLEFTDFDQPVESLWGLPGASNLEAATFLVRGVGKYEELGKFTAALENDYPGLRFRAITISPNEPVTEEKVAFTLEIIGLVSPDRREETDSKFAAKD